MLKSLDIGYYAACVKKKKIYDYVGTDVKKSMLLRNEKVVNRATLRTFDFLLGTNNKMRETLFSHHCPPKFPHLVFIFQKPALSPRTQTNQCSSLFIYVGK